MHNLDDKQRREVIAIAATNLTRKGCKLEAIAKGSKMSADGKAGWWVTLPSGSCLWASVDGHDLWKLYREQFEA